MGAAFKCDICGGVFEGNKPLSIMVKCTSKELGGYSEHWKDICVGCGKKVLPVLDGDFGYVPPRDRIVKRDNADG